jgi:ribosomal protein L17
MLSSLNQHGNPEKCTRTVDKACGFVNEISKILLDKEIIETNEIKFRELQNLYENLIKKTKQENVK